MRRRLQLLFLSGYARPKPELHEAMLDLMSRTVATLAVLQDETRRSILEQWFGFVPSDEEWRDELLPALRKAAEGIVG